MEVREGLFVGGWKELEEGKDKWTHVLSVDGSHSTQDPTGTESSDDNQRQVRRMKVNILDLPSENILQVSLKQTTQNISSCESSTN